MRLGDLPPYFPAYPSQEIIVYIVTEEPKVPVSDSKASLGRRGPVGIDRSHHESASPGENQSIAGRRRTVSLDVGTPGRRRPLSVDSHTGGVEETPGQSKSQPEPKAYKVVTVDKYGRINMADEIDSKMSIYEARELDLKRGGHHHQTVTEALNREYLAMNAALGKRDKLEHFQIGFDGHPDNTGFWIFGAGHAFVLPHQFNDSFQKARYITKIIFLFFLCLLWRSIWLDQTILTGKVHDYLFQHKAYGIPLLVSLCTYVLMSIIITAKPLEPYTRLLGVTIILFMVQECVRTVCYVLFSLACEFAVIMWFETLDIFEDYNVTDPLDRNYWMRLNITPPIFLLIMAASISINIFTALCLEVYTDMTLGTPEMLRATLLTSAMTFLVMVVLVKFYSIGVIPMWDGFQIALGTFFSIMKTWIFLYNLQRLVSGKITHLEGMEIKDVVFGLMLIC